MSDFLLNVLYFAIVFWIGWRARTAVIMYHLSEDPDKMIGILNKIKEINANKSQIESTSSALSEVKIEHHHGHVYLFERATDKFLAQGETVADAVKMINKRFPGQFELETIVSDSHSA